MGVARFDGWGCGGMRIGDELDFLYSEAEATRSCVVATSSGMRNALNRRVARGAAVKLLPGLYLRSSYWAGLDFDARRAHVIRGVADQDHDRVFCFTSAAIIHGLEVPHLLPADVHIVSGKTSRCGRLVRHDVPRRDAVCVSFLYVTPLAQTVFDCIRSLSFPFALAIADSALRVTGRSPSDLVEEIAHCCKGRCGMPRALAILALADGRAENGGESYARAIMLEQGVMAPDLQVGFRDRIGGGTFRTDFGWLGLSGGDVAGELDGVEKTESRKILGDRTIRDALRQERLRESRLTALGLKIARFSFSQARAVGPLLRILDGFGVPRDAGDSVRLPAPFVSSEVADYGGFR